MSAAPSRTAWLERAPLGALIALALVLGCFPMWDFDIWQHLRTGQLMLEKLTLPHTDWYTYTNAERPWVNVYWLFQVAVALLYRLGGVPALVAVKALCGAALVVIGFMARRRDVPAWPAVLCWLPALVVISGRLYERPEVVSLLAIAGFAAVLAHAGARPRLLWALVPIQLVWANCHGLFILGPCMLGAWVVEQLLVRRDTAPWRQLAVAGGASLAACFVTPYGLAGVLLPFEQFRKVGGANVYRATIGELKSLGDFIARAGVSNPYLLAWFACAGLLVASFVWLALRGRVSVFRVLIAAAFGYLGWQATRNSALFALVAALVTAWNVDDALAAAGEAPRTKRERRLAEQVAPRAPGVPEAATLALVCAALLAVVSGGFYRWAGEGRTVGLGERREWYAHEACALLARPGMPERVVAFNISQAAVCIFHAGPQHKQFIDPRLEVNSQQTFEQYLAALRALYRGEPGWDKPLGIDAAKPAEMPALVVEHGQLERGFALLTHDPRWRLVHDDAVAGLFVPATR